MNDIRQCFYGRKMKILKFQGQPHTLNNNVVYLSLVLLLVCSTASAVLGRELLLGTLDAQWPTICYLEEEETDFDSSTE